MSMLNVKLVVQLGCLGRAIRIIHNTNQFLKRAVQPSLFVYKVDVSEKFLDFGFQTLRILQRREVAHLTHREQRRAVVLGLQNHKLRLILSYYKYIDCH